MLAGTFFWAFISRMPESWLTPAKAPSSASPTNAVAEPVDTLPAAIRDAPWIAYASGRWQAGSVAQGLRPLPVNERALATDRSYALSVDPLVPGSLIVRSAEDGGLVDVVTTPLSHIDSAYILGEEVFLSGRGEAGNDLGVWVQDLTGNSPEALIGGDPATPISDMPNRGPLMVSATGRTVASTLCGSDGCRAAAWVRDGESEFRLDGGAIAWLSDGCAVTIEGSAITGTPLAGSGAPWRLETTGSYLGGYFLSSGEGLIIGSTERSADDYVYEVAMVDAVSGSRQVIAQLSGTERDWHLIPELSTDRWVTLLSTYTLEQALEDGQADIRILDLVDGSLSSSMTWDLAGSR